MEKDRMTKETIDNTRDINLQVMINETEFNMLQEVAVALGMKRTEAIRRLIRQEWESLQTPEGW